MQLFLTELYQDSSASKKRGLCLLQLRKDFAFAFKGLLPFAIEGRLPLKGLCLQISLAIQRP
jgi:hypothetical protein